MLLNPKHISKTKKGTIIMERCSFVRMCYNVVSKTRITLHFFHFEFPAYVQTQPQNFRKRLEKMKYNHHHHQQKRYIVFLFIIFLIIIMRRDSKKDIVIINIFLAVQQKKVEVQIFSGVYIFFFEISNMNSTLPVRAIDIDNVRLPKISFSEKRTTKQSIETWKRLSDIQKDSPANGCKGRQTDGRTCRRLPTNEPISQIPFVVIFVCGRRRSISLEK